MPRERLLISMGLLAVLLWLPGCLPVTEFRAARRAEQSGDYHRAYDMYCQAASESPDNRLLAMALERIAPRAAGYWEDRAHQAVDRGDYAQAWQLFMRVLEIRPDHPSAPHLIRRLERDHPKTVGPVRQAWLQRGATVLLASGDRQRSSQRGRSTRPAPEGPESAAESPPVVFAQGPERGPTPDQSPTQPPRIGTDRKLSEEEAAPPTPSATGSGIPKPQSQLPAPSASTVRSASSDDNKTLSPTTTTQPSGGQIAASPSAPDLARADTARRDDATIRNQAGPIFGPSEGPSAFRTVTRPAPRVFGPARLPQKAPESAEIPITGKRVDEQARQPVPTDGLGTPFQFTVVRTLSKKERYFPKTVEVLDGLIIELRSTDDDPKCSLKVNVGNREVAKLKGVKIGQPHPVVGRSGRVYEIVVLDIMDKRQTVRLGIRPTRLRSYTTRE